MARRPPVLIHVPDPELGTAAATDGEPAGDEQPKRKKTRRGSRGGRRRKKKPASAADAAKSEKPLVD